jgi:hypothetical protein
MCSIILDIVEKFISYFQIIISNILLFLAL